MRLVIALAILGALAVAAGVGMLLLPAGVIVAGVEALAAAYMLQYLGARR